MQSRIHPVTASGGCCPSSERRVFFVDRFVLELAPFRILMQAAGKGLRRRTRSVFVDVDAILFEHLLWLAFHERSAASAPFLQLNLMEIIEFYSEED
ncbi:hypothetical protein ZIOFF_011411 [Zingiber officinale]|uniref:Uncharacterized protein n=1 Tax=Zingiber officinale TaxID=94328 RepID=A0A8J5HQE0_ZINOF|nr:hypothetical protein ZIOFF_011411 [Zingiber officinale]